MNAKLIKRIVVAGLALIGLVGAEAFAQATTATVTVNAQVNAACRFITGTATLTLANSGGVIDPAVTSNATGNTTLTYRCTTGTLPEFDIDNSTTFADPKVRVVTLTSGANNLAAQITVAGTGAGSGMGGAGNKTANVSGLINYTPDIENAAVGAYTKDVTVTIQAQ